MAIEKDMEGLLSRAKAGDVVQLKDAQGDWYHSIYVTGLDENGKMAYCGHSTSRYKEPLENIKGAVRYRVISFV